LPTIQIVSERRSPAVSTAHAAAQVPADMIRSVQEIFPNVPTNTIALDLLQTGSVALTIDNLVEGRIVIPEVHRTPPPSPSLHTVNNNSVASQTLGLSSFSGASSHSSSSTSLQQHPHNNSVTTSTSVTSTPTANTNNNVNVADELPKLSDAFATTSSERQNRLQSRKEQLLEFARNQYLKKQTENQK